MLSSCNVILQVIYLYLINIMMNWMLIEVKMTIKCPIFYLFSDANNEGKEDEERKDEQIINVPDIDNREGKQGSGIVEGEEQGSCE